MSIKINVLVKRIFKEWISTKSHNIVKGHDLGINLGCLGTNRSIRFNNQFTDRGMSHTCGIGLRDVYSKQPKLTRNWLISEFLSQ